MSPQENFNFVNAYLKRVSPPIRINNGLIVKYIGDGIMAIFPNGADDAIRAGIGKLKQIEQYNIERQQEDRRPIKIGVGIHVGHMMVGMVGEVARMQGDAFSDNVNLTSRLEGLTKFYGTSLIVSEETLSNLENPSCYQMRYLDRVIVKGRSKPITIFEVLDGEPEQIMNFKLETQAHFEKGMRRYQARDFTEALFHFNEVLSVYPDDKAAILYLERATRFAREGVPSDWEGITVMTEK
jgi:two-component system sensor histidine kinase ChiS